MKTTIVSLRRWLYVILALVFSVIGQAHAEDSFTAQLALYQGRDLVTGMTEFDPTVITLIFNPSDKVDRVLRPDLQEAVFNFSSAVNGYFDYDPAAAQPLLFQPVQVQSVVVLEQTAVETVTSDMLAALTFPPTPSGVHLGPQDTAVVRLADQTYIALGNVTQQPDWTIRFDYRTISAGVVPTPIPTNPPAIPEPSTLIFFGIGFVGLFGFMRRQYKHKRGTGGNRMKTGKIVMFAMVAIPLLASSALAAELTVIKQGTGDGRVVGVGIDCGADCTETYPDESMLQLKALPAADSEFKGWLIDGAPQKGTLVIRKNITLTAIFDKKSQPVQDIQVSWDKPTRTLTITFPSGKQQRIQEKEWDAVWVAISPHGERVAVLYDATPVGSYDSESVTVTLYTRNGDEIAQFPITSIVGKMIVADDGRFSLYYTNMAVDGGAFDVYTADGQLVKTITKGDQKFGGQGDAWFSPFGGLFVIVCKTREAYRAELLILDRQYNLIQAYRFDKWPFPAYPLVNFDEQHEYIEVCDQWNEDTLIFNTQGTLLERRTGCK